MRVLKLELRDHLTRPVLLQALRAIEPDVPAQGTAALLVDAVGLTGYDVDARALFVEWNQQYRPKLQRVAIVTEKLAWRAVISAMALASRQAMKTFRSVAEAHDWAAAG